jgi:hypothetical protein
MAPFIHSIQGRSFMNRLIAAAFLAGALMGAGAANAMPGAALRRHRAPMSSKSPADAARAGIAALWRMPAQLRQSGGAPCPRGWYLGLYGRCRANGT